MYAPHDLSAVEMRKWKARGRPVMDVFDVLDFDPMMHYKVRIPVTRIFLGFCVLFCG